VKLTGKQKRHLRGLGHHLEPVVFVGKNQLTDALLADLGNALRSHELVKLKLQDAVTARPRELAVELAVKSGAELVQVIGRTVLLFLRNDEKPGITLPE